MKRTHLNAIFDAALLHRILDPASDSIREAENQNGVTRGAREVLDAESEDERLLGASDAAGDSVSVAEAPRHLLLMQVHDAKCSVFLCRRLRFQRQPDLPDADLREQQRASDRTRSVSTRPRAAATLSLRFLAEIKQLREGYHNL
jgi:hypothetical protein